MAVASVVLRHTAAVLLASSSVGAVAQSASDHAVQGSLGRTAVAASAEPARATANPAPSVSDYERALRVDEIFSRLVDVTDSIWWQADQDKLVYRKSIGGVIHFLVADPVTGTKRAAFDNAALVSAINRKSGTSYTADRLPFRQVKLAREGRAIRFRIENTVWECIVADYSCSTDELSPDDEHFDHGMQYDGTPSAKNSEEALSCSPDESLCAYIQDFNVFVRRKAGGPAVRLSWDGSEGDYYTIDWLKWSPDSKHIAAYRVRPGHERKIHYVDSSPVDQNQPEYPTMVYPKAGDVLTLQQPVLFDVLNRAEHPIDNSLFPNPYELGDIKWWDDSRGFTFAYNQRGHQDYRIIEVNSATARPRTLIDEPSNTFVNYSPLRMNQQDTGKIYRHDINDGREIIWASERDGYEHLYLFDGRSGRVKGQITKGKWVVRAVNYVDEDKRQIYFEASGMDTGEDPYFVHAYRINFDGTHLTPLTSSDANHHVEFSKDGRFYADLWSRVDLAPAVAIYRTSDNALVMNVDQADLSKLKAAGWVPPEPFVAKGRDGKTDIWGLIYRPANFDPAKHYPVVENIYAGPQGSFVPKIFSSDTEGLTQLGFVVARIDGMGTNNRSRAFHDVAWKNLADAGLPDRILWHKAAAAKYPWYDVSNVGIFGTSAGGQSTLAALEFYPAFYKIGAANSGSYDNRMDKIWWNEQWMGWPVGPQYAAASTIDNAFRLKGKLLITVGEMDHNVDPSSAFQLIDRLIKAHKLFDTLYVPGADHGTPGPYYRLKMFDFFVRNVLGAKTPDWNSVHIDLPPFYPPAKDLEP